jgi:inward rectifier potassium channel
MVQEKFDPGLTTQVGGELRRTINSDGDFNVRRTGVGLLNRSLYLYLVDTTWPIFITIVLAAYLAVNTFFASLFWMIGIEHLHRADDDTGLGPFLSCFFFSVHTLTTVGYGSFYPKGIAMNTVSALEAMTGLMGFALATGLLFSRFSRPSAKIIFSRSMLIAPYQDGFSLQFRIANQRDNVLMEVEARMLMMTVETRDGQPRRIFTDLPLERPNIYFFPLTWTVVHPIDSASPLYGKTADELARLEAEFLILIKGFDDTFSQIVHARFSYRHDEIVWGAKFVPAFYVDPLGDLVLEVGRVGELKMLQK